MDLPSPQTNASSPSGAESAMRARQMRSAVPPASVNAPGYGRDCARMKLKTSRAERFQSIRPSSGLRIGTTFASPVCGRGTTSPATIPR
jgi:hypothetical protein